MTNSPRNTGPELDWLLWAADAEDACRSIAVGGLAADLGMLSRPEGENTHHVFGRLIEYARRQLGLSVEVLAGQADVDLEELVEIERDDYFMPQVRTVHQLASVLKLPSSRLMQVAGLATPRPYVAGAALRFAARSEPTSELSPDERVAFEEFVKVLVETTDTE